MTSEVHDVRVYGDIAIVIARVRNRGEFEGNPFTLDEWSTDVFVRRGDRWRCSSHPPHLGRGYHPSNADDRVERDSIGRQNSRLAKGVEAVGCGCPRRWTVIGRRPLP